MWFLKRHLDCRSSGLCLCKGITSDSFGMVLHYNSMVILGLSQSIHSLDILIILTALIPATLILISYLIGLAFLLYSIGAQRSSQKCLHKEHLNSQYLEQLSRWYLGQCYL